MIIMKCVIFMLFNLCIATNSKMYYSTKDHSEDFMIDTMNNTFEYYVKGEGTSNRHSNGIIRKVKDKVHLISSQYNMSNLTFDIQESVSKKITGTRITFSFGNDTTILRIIREHQKKINENELTKGQLFGSDSIFFNNNDYEEKLINIKDYYPLIKCRINDSLIPLYSDTLKLNYSVKRIRLKSTSFNFTTQEYIIDSKINDIKINLPVQSIFQSYISIIQDTIKFNSNYSQMIFMNKKFYRNYLAK